MPHERSTKQREAIRRAFESIDRPLSPREILAAATSQVSGMGMATVYRAIKDLAENGEIVQVALPGEAPRYELAGKAHHHHFFCKQCRKVFELEGCSGDPAAGVPSGFRAESHDVIVYGLCAGCAASPGTPGAPALSHHHHHHHAPAARAR